LAIRDILLGKHPPGSPLDPNAVVSPSSQAFRPHPVFCDCITGSLIRAVALHVDGAAAPSNIDAHGWRHICTSYHGALTDICNALALLAQRLCTEFVGLAAYTACCLIALDKNPSVRPIRVGEVVRRIIGKTIFSVTGLEIPKYAGSLQLCAGQQPGCESSVCTFFR